MDGKKGVILGVANKRSIAWAIAQSLHREGAQICFTYQGERLKENVAELTAEISSSSILPCDVSKEEEMDKTFSELDKSFGGLDFMVHSIAFANGEDLEGNYLKTKREGFRMALDVSAYSLTSLSQRAAPLMEKRGGGSIITLTYIGGERVAPGYNVMGVAKSALESSVRYLAYDLGPKNIRVNAISSGPIATLAARGISGFTKILQNVRERAPLRRNTEVAEVGDAALFLLSHLGRGVTGEVLHVDCGFHATL